MTKLTIYEKNYFQNEQKQVVTGLNRPSINDLIKQNCKFWLYNIIFLIFALFTGTALG